MQAPRWIWSWTAEVYPFLSPCSTACLYLTITKSMIDVFLGGESTNHALVAEEWPTFLYNKTSGWSINDVRRGHFCGHVLARVCLNSYTVLQHNLTIPNAQVALWIYRNKTAVQNEVPGGISNPKTSIIPEDACYHQGDCRDDCLHSCPGKSEPSTGPSPWCIGFADLCRPLFHDDMGWYGWDIQSHPPLPPDHQNTIQ